MTPELIRALLTIGFGALAGGLTNTVAVWMLFHPYKPPRLGRRRLRFLHGAIPKNQGSLAEAVGRTVGNRLLPNEDLTAILSTREFQAAFDSRLEHFLSGLLETERGSLREMLPVETARAAEELLEGAADHLAERLESWLDSPQFEELVTGRARGMGDRIVDRPVRELLTSEREEAVIAAIQDCAEALVQGKAFREAVDRYVEQLFASLLREDRTLEEVLPLGLASSFERILSSYLPIAVRRLGGIMEDPEARARLQSTLRGLFQRFLRDLRFHQRVVARLVVTEETLERVLETLEEEGMEHISDMLGDPAVQDATARRVNEAVVDFLRRPIASVLGRPGDESVARARVVVVERIVATARDPETHVFLSERVRQGIRTASAGTWGGLLDRVPPDRVRQAAIAVARSAAAQEAYRDILGRLLRSLLDRPIGRPGEWLPTHSATRMKGALSEPLWAWMQAQMPEVVRTLDIGRHVEEKVRAYPASKLEELVRRVTERELRLIVRLGYLLGAGIGTVLVALNAWVG